MDTNNKTIQTKETTMSDMKDRVMQVILAEADVEKGFIPDHAKNKFSDNSGNLKCPFCQQELEIGGVDGILRGCPKCRNLGTEMLWQELIRTRKALDYCIKRFKSLENVLDEKAEASDIPDNPDLYAWAVRIKTIWLELKEITGIDYKTALEQKDVK